MSSTESPKCHTPGLVAYQRRKNIALAKIDTDGNAQRLLSASQKDASFDQSRRGKGCASFSSRTRAMSIKR